jgi:4-hydroxy-4-methyl-2-oxoglutarate aldolase
MEQSLKKLYEPLYCGLIYDVMKFDLKLDNFVIPRSAGPIIPAWDFKGYVFGKAFTAVGHKTPNPDETIIRDMIDDLEHDSVYILQANDNSRAHFGDITAKFLQRAGVQGAIIQGWTRDIQLIEEDNFKIWCKGVQPQDSFDRWHITDYKCPIVIGNIFITPQDYIYADRDGIIVIPEQIVYEVAELAHKRKLKEDKIRNIILTTDMSSTEIEQQIGRW